MQDRICQIDETSCNAHGRSGPYIWVKSVDLAAAQPRPVYVRKPTSRQVCGWSGWRPSSDIAAGASNRSDQVIEERLGFLHLCVSNLSVKGRDSYLAIFTLSPLAGCSQLPSSSPNPEAVLFA
jgi:hypothetical protein